MLAWSTSAVSLLVLAITLNSHDWGVFLDASLEAPVLLVWMLLLWPVNLSLEVYRMFFGGVMDLFFTDCSRHASDPSRAAIFEPCKRIWTY